MLTRPQPLAKLHNLFHAVFDELLGPTPCYPRARMSWDRALVHRPAGNHDWSAVPYDYIQEPAGARITPLKDVEQCIGCRRYRVAGRLLDPFADMDDVVRLAGGKSQVVPNLVKLTAANFAPVTPPTKSKEGKSSSN